MPSESTGCQGQLPSLEVGCCDLLNLLIAAEQTELVGHVRGTLKVSDTCQDTSLHSVFTCVGKWYMYHGVKHMGWFSAGHMSNTCTGNGIPWSINHNNV